ncbi:hypothetical protein [Methanolobus profundi]|uniref:Uncharacterized protein n=1 Tax=Methanolobus profundi TaxID=487685 RepID=A0A1I4TIP6_9EURY|nr:hypothetical protein [Methanolobus profundi]SFM76559.1 hypothetical protein SAMN04488696_2285 [Methanolobus profundi]
MDTLSAILIGIALFVAFVLFTAYFLKSYIVMNSMEKAAKSNGSADDEDASDPSGSKEQK